MGFENRNWFFKPDEPTSHEDIPDIGEEAHVALQNALMDSSPADNNEVFMRAAVENARTELSRKFGQLSSRDKSIVDEIFAERIKNARIIDEQGPVS